MGWGMDIKYVVMEERQGTSKPCDEPFDSTELAMASIAKRIGKIPRDLLGSSAPCYWIRETFVMSKDVLRAGEACPKCFHVMGPAIETGTPPWNVYYSPRADDHMPDCLMAQEKVRPAAKQQAKP